MNPLGMLKAARRKLSRSAGFTRAHERLACSAIGEVLFIEKGCRLSGVIDEVSRGGIRMRPANSYILKRMGENIEVRITFGRFDIMAILVNTSSQGYGFKLGQLLHPDELAEIIKI